MRLVAVLLLILTGCQMQPTKVSEVQYREFDLLMDKASRPLELSDAVVVLDARSRFDYGLNHVVGALNVPWENFSEDSQTGELPRDTRKAASRLALLGLTPKTPVIVVGYGLKGRGEEGRLAFALLYLGMNDVQVASNDLFRKNWTVKETPPRENAAGWDPSVRDGLVIGRDEFLNLARDAKGRVERKIFMIDTRSMAEYAKKPKGTLDFGALNMEWKEFYTADGRPNAAVAAKLQSLGIGRGDRIVLFSNRGVRSAAAAYALLSLGFNKVQVLTTQHP